MFLKVQLTWNIVVSAESLYENGAMLRRLIVRNLFDEFSERKAAEDVGYFVAITTLDNIGVGKIRPYGEVEFPVEFSAITFKLLKGEVVEGVVEKVNSFGVHLACGPAEEIFLSKKRMPEYHYVDGDNPMFLNDSTSAKIEKDDVVRVRVIGTQWLPEMMDFRAVVGFPAGEE